MSSSVASHATDSEQPTLTSAPTVPDNTADDSGNTTPPTVPSSSSPTPPASSTTNLQSTESVKYAEKYGIFPLLEELIQKLIYNHPDEPIGYLVDVLAAKAEEGGSVEPEL